MVRKIIIFLVVVILLLAGPISYVLYSKSFLFYTVKKLIETNDPEAHIRIFDYQSRQFKFPGQLILNGVKLYLERKGQTEELRWNHLTVVHISGLFDNPRKIRVLFDDFDADIPPSKINGLNLNLNIELVNNKVSKMTGQLDASSAGFDNYKVVKVTSFIDGDEKQIRFNNLTAEGYRGKVQGQILLEYAPRLAYSIQCELLGIDLGSMQSANPALFSQVDGKFNGQAKIKGDLKIVSGLEAEFDIPQGGTIKAAWLKFVIDYIPPSAQKRDLDLLIKNDGNVPVEKATLQLRNLSPEKLTSVIKINSAKLNLDINLTVDINVEGGLNELFKYGKAFD